MNRERHILIATGTRADWGLLSPLANALKQAGALVTVAATNSHLNHAHGYTIDEIRADGFDPIAVEASGTPSEITAKALLGFSNLFSHLDSIEKFPDTIVILGDRFEMQGVATAALLAGIPIAHIAGGTVSEGAFDDQIRNSISKMATLHFPETEHCRHRLLLMGEEPALVIAAGALGVYNILRTPLMDKQTLEESLGWTFPETTLLATMHPATLDKISPLEQIKNLIEGIEIIMTRYKNEGKQLGVLFTYPNNDSDPEPAIKAIENFAYRHPGDVYTIPSLGRIRYLSALNVVDAVVGNSSSGLVEVPSAGIPTLDIGIRQAGRECGPSVIHCDCSVEGIVSGLQTVLSSTMKVVAAKKENPYFRTDTLRLITDKILENSSPRFPKKKFVESISFSKLKNSENGE